MGCFMTEVRCGGGGSGVGVGSGVGGESPGVEYLTLVAAR